MQAVSPACSDWSAIEQCMSYPPPFSASRLQSVDNCTEPDQKQAQPRKRGPLSPKATTDQLIDLKAEAKLKQRRGFRVSAFLCGACGAYAPSYLFRAFQSSYVWGKRNSVWGMWGKLRNKCPTLPYRCPTGAPHKKSESFDFEAALHYLPHMPHSFEIQDPLFSHQSNMRISHPLLSGARRS